MIDLIGHAQRKIKSGETNFKTTEKRAIAHCPKRFSILYSLSKWSRRASDVIGSENKVSDVFNIQRTVILLRVCCDFDVM